jgi:uncharacterized membrane protein
MYYYFYTIFIIFYTIFIILYIIIYNIMEFVTALQRRSSSRLRSSAAKKIQKRFRAKQTRK